MEGGFPFGMFGDPGDMQKHLQEMAEQMQAAQKVGWADNAINLAVQMTVACINRLDLAGQARGAGRAGARCDPRALPRGGHARARGARGPHLDRGWSRLRRRRAPTGVLP